MRFSKLLRVFILLSFALLAACETLTGLRQDFADRVFGREPANPPAELEDIKPTYTAKIDWSSNTGKTEKYDYTPAQDSSALYVANVAGELAKIDIANGRQLWRVNIGEPISGGVGIGAGTVLVGSKKGFVHAYDAAGKFLWKAKVSSEILSVPRYFDGVVVVRTGDNHIFGLDAADGTRKWVYERINPTLTLRSSVGVVVDGGAVYAGFAGGKLIAIRADNGKLLWESTVAQPRGVTEIERIADITSLPVVDGPVVYAVAYQGKIAAIDRRTGKVFWNRDISSYSGMSAEEGKVLVSHTLGAVYSLDYETGKTFWRQGALSNRRLTAPLPMGDVVAVGDLEGYVHFLSRDEGKFVARIKLDSNAVMSIAQGVKTSQLIAETRDGGLYSVSVAKMENPTTNSSSEEPSRKAPLPYYGDVPTPVPQKSKSVPASENSKGSENNKDSEINKDSSDLEKTIIEKQESAPAAPETGSSERSILFKNDSILLPDAGADNTDGGPGIRLPAGQ